MYNILTGFAGLIPFLLVKDRKTERYANLIRQKFCFSLIFRLNKRSPSDLKYLDCLETSRESVEMVEYSVSAERADPP
ncbi:hypothetical protein Pyn_06125 [Prunus yedoensis var. nudiflora]|uniref:Uncharacterized protein n=1 Tax=Prunus yedoensis var. nudiflora TaxID=2094558 RepID=A0A314Y6J9_PRUYE|nr:hypothetical protein Pyn_06125 [Prunus yedoensis var. nudiflora]